MTNSSITVEIDKVKDGATRSVSDAVAVEEPLEIQVVAPSAAGSAAKSVSITMRTPDNDEELATGFLFTEGIISCADQILETSVIGDKDADTGLRNTVRLTLSADVDIALEKLQRHFYTTSSCGVCGKASLDALHVSGQKSLAGQLTKFTYETLLALPDRVRDRQAVFASTGGLHAAAVFTSDGEIVAVREDIGRHNATDKVIGALLNTGNIPGHRYGLLVSGRASFELIQKALVARIPLLAAVGAPSSLAVRTAQEFGMTLIGFLRDGSFNIYSGAMRVTDGTKQQK